MDYDAAVASPVADAALLAPLVELSNVNPLREFSFVKCSSIMIFPARLKSHSALNVYFPIGESLLT
jgi:hypothetical protein